VLSASTRILPTHHDLGHHLAQLGVVLCPVVEMGMHEYGRGSTGEAPPPRDGCPFQYADARSLATLGTLVRRRQRPGHGRLLIPDGATHCCACGSCNPGTAPARWPGRRCRPCSWARCGRRSGHSPDGLGLSILGTTRRTPDGGRRPPETAPAATWPRSRAEWMFRAGPRTLPCSPYSGTGCG
jgi:hypothetical protein